MVANRISNMQKNTSNRKRGNLMSEKSEQLVITFMASELLKKRRLTK